MARIFRKAVLFAAAASAFVGVAAGRADSGGLPSPATVAKLRAARVAALNHDPAGELRLLQEAVRENPESLEAATALLERHRRLKLDDTPIQPLEATIVELLGRDPPPPLAVIVRISQGRLDHHLREGLVRALDRHVATALQDPLALATLANTLLELDRVEQAVLVLERLQRARPADGMSWTLYAAYLRLERYGDALQLIEQNLEAQPGLRPQFCRLLAETGQFERLADQVDLIVASLAVPPTGPALQTAPTQALAPVADAPRVMHADAAGWLVGLAWILYDHGQDAAAERLFRASAERFPASDSARLPVLHLFGRPEERAALAVAHEDRWRLELDPQALFDEGSRRVAAGDAAGGIDLLKRAAAGMTDSEPAWYNLGMTAFRVEDWATAGSALANAARLQPERKGTAFYAGVALVKVRQCREAIAQLQQALALEPDRFNAHFHLADCYAHLGQTADAERHREIYRQAKAKADAARSGS